MSQKQAQAIHKTHSGSAFRALRDKMAAQGVKNPDAAAAAAGRAKYGKAGFQRQATAGRMVHSGG